MATLHDLEQALRTAQQDRNEPIGITDVLRILENNLPSWDEIEPLVPHGEPYGRVTLFEGSNYEVMIGCWDKGGWCDAHDHGPSVGAVYGYKGSIEHATYELHGDVLAVTERCTISHDTLMPLPLGMIHSLSNTSSQEPFVGLHVYSPPPSNVRVFHLPTGDIYHITNDHGAWVPTDPTKIRRVEQRVFAYQNRQIASEVEH